MRKYSFTKEEEQIIIDDYVNNLISIKEIGEKYNIKSKTRITTILGNNVRSKSEALKISHKKYPERFKHTEESKKKISMIRLEYMKNNPEKTAWRMKNISYPEKIFKKILNDNGFDKKFLIIREYPVFPFYIDFAFVDLKLAVEIDGSQHLLVDRKQKDDEKDNLLIKNGWSVLRFTAYDVLHNKEMILLKLNDVIGDNKQIYERVGILRYPKLSLKKERGEDGLTNKERERAFKQRRCEWPSKEELSKLTQNMSFTKIGEMYGVSDNAIKNWCKKYNLPYKKSDINPPKPIKKCQQCNKILHEKAMGNICLTCIREGVISRDELEKLSIDNDWNRYKVAEILGFHESYIRQLWKKHKLK